MSRESDELGEEQFYEQFNPRSGDYLASLAEDYFYATHPDERPWLMDDIEVADIIKRYKAEINHA